MDLQFLKTMNHPKSVSYNQLDQKHYAAPEFLVNLQNQNNSNPFSEKVDIWSFGLIILETYIGYNPLEQEFSNNFLQSDFKVRIDKIKDFILKFKNHPEEFLGENYDKIFFNFIIKCLTIDPNERSSAKTLLNHKWLEPVLNADNKMVVESLTFKYLKDYINYRKTNMNKSKSLSEPNFGEDSENIFG